MYVERSKSGTRLALLAILAASFVCLAHAIPVRVLVRYTKDIDIDIDVPKGKDVDVEIELPAGAKDIDVDIELPEGNDIDVDVELPAGKGIDVDVQFPADHNIDLDLELPEGHNIDLDVQVPKGHDVDVDMEFPKGHELNVDMQMPSKPVYTDIGLTGTEDYDEEEDEQELLDFEQSVRVPMWEGDDCEGLSEGTCTAMAGCVWCKSAAIPSSCFTEDQSKRLPPGVFECS